MKLGQPQLDTMGPPLPFRVPLDTLQYLLYLYDMIRFTTFKVILSTL